MQISHVLCTLVYPLSPGISDLLVPHLIFQLRKLKLRESERLRDLPQVRQQSRLSFQCSFEYITTSAELVSGIQSAHQEMHAYAQ